MRRLLLSFLLPLAIAGCVHIDLTQHVAAADIGNARPRRIFVVNGLTSSFIENFDTGFSVAIARDLEQCGVTVDSFIPDSMKLDNAKEGQQALKTFGPDAVMNIVRTLRVLHYGADVGARYQATLISISQKRDLWKAEFSVDVSNFAKDRAKAASDVARLLVDQMSKDGVLGSCPAASERS